MAKTYLNERDKAMNECTTKQQKIEAMENKLRQVLKLYIFLLNNLV